MDYTPFSNWILILLVGPVIFMVIRWIFHANPSDSFNTALKQYNNLKSIMSSDSKPSEIAEEVIRTVQVCQASIRTDSKFGDTYVLLANTYLGMAQTFHMNGIYSLGVRLAAAVMMYWQDNPNMYTRNRRQAETVLKMLADVHKHMQQGMFSTSDRNRHALEKTFRGEYRLDFARATEPLKLDSLKNEVLAWLALEDALTQLAHHDYQKALDTCQTAADLCSDLAEVHFVRAQIMLTSGAFLECITEIDMFELIEGKNDVSTTTRLLAQARLQESSLDL